MRDDGIICKNVIFKEEKCLQEATAVAKNGGRKEEDDDDFKADPISIDFMFFYR